MKVNTLPRIDMKDNPTNCCPRFKPEKWDEQELYFKDKLFLKAKTKAIFHIPLNMGSVFSKTFKAIKKANANDECGFCVLSFAPSLWSEEHLFAVSKDVPNMEMVRLSGNYLTKVFEGSYSKINLWKKNIKKFVENKGKQVQKIYWFYTTCPKCAKFYKKNYVVGIVQVD